jgi:ankyrin repeat protein
MADRPAVVRLLLEHGARTQDGESIYHAAQHNRHACLDLLLAHGADLSSPQQPFGNTPLYFLAGHHSDNQGRADWFLGLNWLLDHGADPNVPSYHTEDSPLHVVAASPHLARAAEALVIHGADVNRRRKDRRTPYQIAVRCGNTAAADLFRRHGADESVLGPTDSFLNACLTGDAARAREELAKQPSLVDSLDDQDRGAMTIAVGLERPDVIRLMAQLGFSLGAEGRGGGTPLHWAAWLGKLSMVELCISLGSPIETRDSQYGASPLGWAAHGSSNFPHNEASYCAIVDRLVDAGATREGAINKWGVFLEGTPRVAERLRTRLG